MKITLQFFGMLAEVVKAESILDFETSATTVIDLKTEVENAFPTLKTMSFQLAMNNKLVSELEPINANSTVAFLPPFAGG